MASPRFAAIVGDKTRGMGMLFPAYLLVRSLVFASSLGIPLAFGALIDCLAQSDRRGLFAQSVLAFAAVSLAGIALKYASEVLNQRLDASLVFASSQSAIGKFFASDLRSIAKYEPASLLSG